MKDDDPLIPEHPAHAGGPPPVPVDAPLDDAEREQIIHASGIQQTIDTERFRAYSRISRAVHFLLAVLLMLHDLLEPASVWFYEVTGEIQVDLVRPSGGMAKWFTTERLLPLYVVLQTVLFHYLLPERVLSSRTKLMVEGWIDLLWITVAVSLTGGVTSPFVFLYLVVILNAAPSQSRIVAIAKVAASTVLLAAAFIISDRTDEHPWSALIWPVSFLWIASYLSGAFEDIARSLSDRLLRETVRDDLTGLYTFRFFISLPDRSADRPYSIVVFDADHLKEVNDTWGHDRGTELIRYAAEAIRAAAREGDVCARLGGDEFIVRLRGTGAEGAAKYASRVRDLCSRLPVELPGGGQFPVMLSAGIASCPEHGRELGETIRQADAALYESKRLGRNRVTVWSPALVAGSGSQYLGGLGMGAQPKETGRPGRGG
ncbi:MAG: GGDEF domain-containing protein [Deltaproteobacteria bacterium]|nr:GGDEF domain-containing protein [Deltaproteobacteria bacterium]